MLTLATSGADLSGAVLCEVHFPIANLGRANLSRTDVSWAIRQTDLLEGKLRYGAFGEIPKSIGGYRSLAPRHVK